MIVTQQQIKQLNDIQINKFKKELVLIYPDLTAQELTVIANEAIAFDLKKKPYAMKYAELYHTYRSIFKQKPSWLVYVLKGKSYSADDKLNYIEKNLKK